MSTNKKLDAARARVATLKRDISAVETMGPSRAEIRSQTAAYLAQVEAQGQGAIGRRITDPGERLHAGGLLAPVGAKNDLAPVLLALLGVDAVMASLDRHMAALPEGLDAPARAARLDALRAELFQAELAEEAQVMAAEDRGERVTRRADADPAAVLFKAA
jgi:hypothetical protein